MFDAVVRVSPPKSREFLRPLLGLNEEGKSRKKSGGGHSVSCPHGWRTLCAVRANPLRHARFAPMLPFVAKQRSRHGARTLVGAVGRGLGRGGVVAGVPPVRARYR